MLAGQQTKGKTAVGTKKVAPKKRAAPAKKKAPPAKKKAKPTNAGKVTAPNNKKKTGSKNQSVIHSQATK